MLNLEPGQEVLYKNKKWNVLYVWRTSDNVVVQITLVRLEFGDIDGVGVTLRQKRVDASPEEISECKHELTAREYAEKLRQYFGKPEIGELDIKDCFCSERDCKGCAFDTDTNCAAAVVMFDPERALQMIQEAKNKDKPKGKTYREDFFEKFPNAVICSDGTPTFCRCEAYGGKCEVSDYPEEEECVHCWNEVMPETRDEK